MCFLGVKSSLRSNKAGKSKETEQWRSREEKKDESKRREKQKRQKAEKKNSRKAKKQGNGKKNAQNGKRKKLSYEEDPPIEKCQQPKGYNTTTMVSLSAFRARSLWRMCVVKTCDMAAL